MFRKGFIHIRISHLVEEANKIQEKAIIIFVDYKHKRGVREWINIKIKLKQVECI